MSKRASTRTDSYVGLTWPCCGCSIVPQPERESIVPYTQRCVDSSIPTVKCCTALLLVPLFLAVDWNVWVWMGIFHIRDSARWLLLLESLHCSQGPRSKPVVFRLSQEWKPVLK